MTVRKTILKIRANFQIPSLFSPSTSENTHQKLSWGFSKRTTARVNCEGIDLTHHAAAEILSEAVNLFKDKQNALIASHADLTDGS